jgi:hypothetical protein
VASYRQIINLMDPEVVNAFIETGGDKPRSEQPETGRIRSNAFSWSMAMNLPTLKQTRFWSVSRGLSDLWTDINREVKSIRSHSP